jgi:hypothetical protein
VAIQEAILQAHELLARDKDDTVWINTSDFQAQVREWLDTPEDKMGSAQWVDHIMKSRQHTDHTQRKAHSGGQMYLKARDEHELNWISHNVGMLMYI